MGQVPASGISPFGIVGSGRVARHFLHYLKLLGLSASVWSRHAPGPSPPEALAPCRTVLLLISDDAIEPFAIAWPQLQTKRLVHFSGSLETAVAEAAHPLMTFGPRLYDLDEYRRIPFMLDRGGTPFRELLPGLPNPSFTMSAADRPYYHALCVMAGNFSTMLWLKLFDEFQRRLGIPPSAAHPYLARMTANLITDAGTALTGPLSRGDARAVSRNLRALERDPFHAVYTAFVKAYEQRS
jgi:predicted short-subunit dehydrogenase-like oxidoreductase (DUF2520 family)